MSVINRNGKIEPFDLKKTEKRLRGLSDGLNVNVTELSIFVIKGFNNNIKTAEIDELSAFIAYDLSHKNKDYAILAYRIKYDNLIKSTPTYEEYIKISDIRPEIKEIMKNIKISNKQLDLNFLSLSKLMDGYLLKNNDGELIERPSYLFARVAAEIGGDDFQELYDLFINKNIIHSSPTNFNSGMKFNQLASCFLLDCEDSVDGIINLKSSIMKISSRAGGIGFNLNRIRCIGSRINSTKGKSPGIIPILESINKDIKIFNHSGRRDASAAVYLSPYHPEFEEFIRIKDEKSPFDAKELFYGLWISDEFMRRVENNEDWNYVRDDISDYFGNEFVKKLNSSEVVKTINARTLWKKILLEQCGGREPMYVCFKDIINSSSNLVNENDKKTIIRSSNLCTEIMEPCVAGEEISVCNLACINLKNCIIDGKFNFDKFRHLCHVEIKALNNTIDKSFYPTAETKTSNNKHRPIGLGYAGLHNVFINLNICYDSEEAKKLMFEISEHMYYYCLEASYKLSKISGPHESFPDTKLAKGIFHWEHFELPYALTLDWEKLRTKILKHGVRNGLLIALMPTASTSELLGLSPSFEAYTGWIYKRKIGSKEYIMIVDEVVEVLESLNLWNKENIDYMKRTGRLPDNEKIPKEIKELFKTAFEMDYNVGLDLSIIRNPFVDQSQSLNHFIDRPTPKMLNDLYFKAWRSKIKTASYYIHKVANKGETCKMCVV